jgi:hypothetical protein
MEIVILQHWFEADLTCPTQEQSILNNWKFITKQCLLSLPHNPSRGDIPSQWSPPPVDFIKENFDGPSKGKLGEAGFCVVF